MPCHIVFDLDGTLIDSAPDIQATANSLLSEDDLAPLTLAETRSFIGKGAAHFVAQMCAARGLGADARDMYLPRFLDRYETAVEHTHPYPGVREVLSALTEDGHRLALCTNKPLAPCRSVLTHLAFERFFDVLVAGDNLPRRKPDPAPLLHAIEQLGGGRAVYVGDSEVDAETAQRAGIAFLLFTEGYRKSALTEIPHQASFAGFADLPDLIKAAHP